MQKEIKRQNKNFIKEWSWKSAENDSSKIKISVKNEV